MNASKENARRALETAQTVRRGGITRSVELEFVVGFIEAAERKLPSEAAFKRERLRRKSKAGK